MNRWRRTTRATGRAGLGLLAALAALPWPGAAPPAGAQEAGYRVGEPVRVSAARPTAVHVEPTVAASPRDPDRMVAAAIMVVEPRSERWHDSQRVVVYASRDGGRSWEPRPLPGPPGGWMSGDPWLEWADGDVVYLSVIASESIVDGRPSPVQIYRSTDGGWKWSGPTEPFPAGTVQDHPVIASGSGPDGEPRLYAFASSGDADDAVDVAVLEPGARRFRSLPSFVPGSAQVNLGGAGVVPGGGVVFTWFTMGARPWGFSAVAGGDDGGWTSVRLREGILPVGFPAVAVDDSAGAGAGRVYAVWVEGAGPLDQEEPRVLLARSDHGGRSWSEPTRVHGHVEPARRSIPAVAVNGDGVVGVAWLDGRHRPGRSDCPAVYFAASMDGGSSFLPEVRVQGPACFGTEANGVAARRWGTTGGGEYLGLAAGADGAFHLVWPGSATGVFQAWTVAVRVAPARPPSPRR